MLVDVLRLGLVVALCALGAFVVRVALERRRNGPAAGVMPWWTTLSWLGFIIHALLSQVGRIGDDSPSWRFWLVAASAAIGIAGMRSIITRRR